MKQILVWTLFLLLLSGCGSVSDAPGGNRKPQASVAQAEEASDNNLIVLSDQGILVNGSPASQERTAAVYIAHDIVYYPTGQDFTFGEGTGNDCHDPSEANRHTVIHITQPGIYRLTGTLSAGQIAVDLGKDAKKDPSAIVTLILDQVDLTCTVAPAVIFYHVYECGDKDTATKTVDTRHAGANIILADGTENHIHGSYVAKIYKPDSVALNQEGTAVTDAKKLHKYDGACYSKMSMNIDGDGGVLNLHAENEGLCSELHLTINGGSINIRSGNDGINTNEDGVSVTTINGGNLDIQITGETGEGDGIDSNGWVVINGGSISAAACGASMDSGLDSDLGVHLNGGTVVASGTMLDQIAESRVNYAVFQFNNMQSGAQDFYLKSGSGETLFQCSPRNPFTYLVIASDQLNSDTCTFWCGQNQLHAASSSAGTPMDIPGGTPLPSDETHALPQAAPGRQPASENPSPHVQLLPGGSYYAVVMTGN